MYCPNCGKPNDDNSRYCDNCGTLLNPVNQPMPQNNEFNQNNQNYQDYQNYQNNSNVYSNDFNPSTQTMKINSIPIASENKVSKSHGWLFAIVAVILGLFNPFLGIIVAIVGISTVNKEKKVTGNKNFGPTLCVLAIVLITVIVIIGIFVDLKNDSKARYSITINNGSSTDEDSKSKIKGQFSKDVFSGNQFDYAAGSDTAVFVFNKDSTFNINYASGYVYKGTYELYNGTFIYTKTDKVRKDTSISSNEILADSIDDSANRMKNASSDFENVYLLWLKVDDDLIQPFLVLYNPSNNTGTVVNVLARMQGTIALKK